VAPVTVVVVRFKVAPEHIGPLLAADAVGAAVITTVTEEVAEHPALVTVTV
jgi:hypothetical protein